MATPAALARRIHYEGPALFSYGFRPFFLAGAAWAALGVLLWLPQFFGEIALPTAMAPLDWHVHEMIFGYVAAVVAGFLLTAIPNWTGRLPVCGLPLALLAALWLSGRIAILTSQIIGVGVAAAIDLSFLAVLALVVLREIVAGSNWRNLRVLIVLGVLLVGNVVFHVEVLNTGAADYGTRIGIAAVIAFIMLIGGRIVPSFTHNWLARSNPGRLPVPFSRFDAISLMIARLGVGRLGCSAPPSRHRRPAHARRRSPAGAARPLGRRPHARRSARARAARRLCVRPARICARRRQRPVARSRARKRRRPRLGDGCHRINDARGHDAREPWAYRTAAEGLTSPPRPSTSWSSPLPLRASPRPLPGPSCSCMLRRLPGSPHSAALSRSLVRAWRYARRSGRGNDNVKRPRFGAAFVSARACLRMRSLVRAPRACRTALP